MPDGEGMSPERYQHVKHLFEAAIQLGPGQRPAFLTHACQGDEQLRLEVEQMLLSDEQATGFLDDSPLPSVAKLLETTATQQMVGLRIGPYELIRELGRGGMGAVYLAARADDQYRKEVAIKVVLRRQLNPAAVERFRRERQILANLEHPNIARLLDGGTTEDGVPYLVMEYIEGAPIDEYCDARKLNVTARLRLFLDVCAALECAHRNLTVHRDLKPTNILVKPDGTVKLLDFGIAKLVGPAADSGSVRTSTSIRLMTPAYASPEQLRGDAVSTSTDVYQLGVVLYELLTGHPPFEVNNRAELMLVQSTQDPEPPSQAVFRRKEGSPLTPENIAATREGTPGRLRRRLEGDLDSILLLALRRAPNERYSSAGHFADDIRRHLEDRPVRARKATPSYLARKFLSRRRTAVVAAAFALAALVAGSGFAAWEAHKANRESARVAARFAESTRFTRRILTDLHDRMETITGAEAARQLLVDNTSAYLDAMAPQAASDPALASALTTAYTRLGEIQAFSLCARDAALASLRKALAVDPSYALAHAVMGEVLLEGREREAAFEAFQKARALAGQQQPGRETAHIFHRLAPYLLASGQKPAAVDYARRALMLAEKPPQDKRLLFQARLRMGQALEASGEPGLEYLRQARQLAATPREAAAAEEELAVALLRRGDSAGALDAYGKAAAAWPSPGPAAGLVHLRMGDAFRQAGLAEPAAASYQKAAEIFNGSSFADLAYALERLGDLHAAAGKAPAALDARTRLLDVCRNWNARGPQDTRANLALGYAHTKYAAAQLAAGNAQLAVEGAGTAVTLFEALAARQPGNPAVQSGLALAALRHGQGLVAAGRHGEAAQSLERSKRLFEELNKLGALRIEDSSLPSEAEKALAELRAAR